LLALHAELDGAVEIVDAVGVGVIGDECHFELRKVGGVRAVIESEGVCWEH
jgi:hypothetical protein